MILLILALAFFGVKAWYFPNERTWFLAVPIVTLSLTGAILLIPRSMHLYATKGKKFIAAACMVTCIPMLSGLAFGLGAPALALHFKGPDHQIAATVQSKRTATRRCRRKIELAGYAPAVNHRLCLTPEEFAPLQQGKKVVLAAREGYFGTLAFTIQPAE